MVAELVKAFVHRGQEAPLYHWRDASGHELDVLIDFGHRQLPVEIKAGGTVASDAFDNLRWWTGLPANPNDGGLLIYGGQQGERRHGFAVLPWSLSAGSRPLVDTNGR